jgi:hypothetical protein
MHCQASARTSISRGVKLTSFVPAMLKMFVDVVVVEASKDRGVKEKLKACRTPTVKSREGVTSKYPGRGGDTLLICPHTAS